MRDIELLYEQSTEMTPEDLDVIFDMLFEMVWESLQKKSAEA